MNKKGYTLIEILVVLTIIFILAALILAVGEKVRKKAKALEDGGQLLRPVPTVFESIQNS